MLLLKITAVFLFFNTLASLRARTWNSVRGMVWGQTSHHPCENLLDKLQALEEKKAVVCVDWDCWSLGLDANKAKGRSRVAQSEL